MYKTTEPILLNYIFYDENNPSTPLSGKVLGDLILASLMVNGTTDKTSLLSMTEIGTTGQYVIAFTPDIAGHYSLIFTEPLGTLGYNHRESMEVFDYATITGPAINTLYDIVRSHVKDEANLLQTTDYDEAIASAILNVFSDLAPKEKVYPLVGDDTTQKIRITSLLGFVDGWSVIRMIETPIEQSPMTMLDEGEDYWMARDETSAYLWLKEPIATGYTARIVYSTYRQGDGADLLITEARRVAFLAAGFALEKMAALYLQQQSAAFGGAVAEFRTRADESASRAREYIGLFYSFFGGDGKQLVVPSPPAYVRAELTLEASPTQGPRVRLTH